MGKRVRPVAGRSRQLTHKPVDNDGGHQQSRASRVLLWPFQSLWNLVGTIAVAVILGYTSTQQSLLYDKIEQNLLGLPPLDSYQYLKPSDYPDSYAWVSDSILTGEEARSNKQEAIRELADTNKAFPQGDTAIGFILKGTRSEPITITQMTAKVVGRKPAPSAMLVNKVPKGGGGSVAMVVHVGFDLDSSTKVARTFEPDGTLGGPLLQSQHFVLAKGEELSFLFEAITEGAEILYWEIEIQVKDRDQEQIVTLGDQEFAVSGAVDNYATIYD